MANALNANPIIIDTDFVSWRATQTLNTGSLPGYTFKRQPGIHVTKLMLESNGTTVAGVVTITDPLDSTILWTSNVIVTAGAAGTVLDEDDFQGHFPGWRDFSVTGVTATVTKLFIWYSQ